MSLTIRFRLPLGNTPSGAERVVSDSQARHLIGCGAAELVESPEMATEPAPETGEPAADAAPADGGPASEPAPAAAEPTPQEIREWATAYGLKVPAKGRIPKHIRAAYFDNH